MADITTVLGAFIAGLFIGALVAMVVAVRKAVAAENLYLELMDKYETLYRDYSRVTNRSILKGTAKHES